MNKQEFMDKLRSLLKNVDKVEYNNAIEYYEEYFNEAGSENEQRVIEELDSPYIIANKIIASDTVKKIEGGQNSTIIGMKGTVFTVLSILALPIALPISIAIVSVLFAFVVALFSIYFAACITGVSLIVGGIVSLIISLVVVFSDLATGLQFLGAALTLAGLGGLIFIIAFKSGKFIFIKLTINLNKGINKIISLLKKKRGNENGKKA